MGPCFREPGCGKGGFGEERMWEWRVVGLDVRKDDDEEGEEP